MKTANIKKSWLVWTIFSLALTSVLAYGLYFDKKDGNALRMGARSLLSPDTTTSGHYQIELACEVCHPKSFASNNDLKEACLKCHSAELKEARDSHAQSKFTDPRNADRAKKLDATNCVTCHIEHKPHMTQAMGVTIQKDFCKICHDDVATERPSHKGTKFDTCSNAGCHNYHDNRALYEDLYLKHANDPPLTSNPVVAEKNFATVLDELPEYPLNKYPHQALTAEQIDWKQQANNEKVKSEWLTTAHANAGVNCSACHQSTDKKDVWIEHPSIQICNTCHSAENQGFAAGKHGMRSAQELSPMTPGKARLPMRKETRNKLVNCNSCHAAHRFDVKTAAVESCLTCHNDQHSLAYKQSSHYALWQKELAGQGSPGSGVSCASCHLPRIEFTTPSEVERILVQHNQNDNLRPNSKMIRSVCMRCHSLSDSLNALADRKLIDSNFKGKSSIKIKSIEMAVERDRKAKLAAPPATTSSSDDSDE